MVVAVDEGCSVHLIGMFLITKGNSVVSDSLTGTATFSCFIVIGITDWV
jgi:hypothetical protein